MPVTISGTTGVQGNLTGAVTGNVVGNVTGNLTGSVTGNASTATLATSASTAVVATSASPSSSLDLATCKAWCRFNGTYGGPLVGLSYTRSGNTVTVTYNSSLVGWVGLTIYVASATDPGLNGVRLITSAVTNTSFSFQTNSTGATSGTMTVTTPMGGGYNIAGIQKLATGRYTIYFTTPMRDAEYSVIASPSVDGVWGVSGTYKVAHAESIASTQTAWCTIGCYSPGTSSMSDPTMLSVQFFGI